MKRRVAITGRGVVSAVGVGVEPCWRALVAGRSGIRRISRYDASGFPVRIAAEVRNFRLSDHTDAPAAFVPPTGCPCPLDRRTQYALAAAEMSVRDAGLEGADDWRNATLYFGSGEGDNDLTLLAGLIGPWACGERGCDPSGLLGDMDGQGFPLRDQLMEPTAPASLLAERYGIRGEVSTCLTACAASAQAIGEAARRIQYGEYDLGLAGGSHAMTAPLDVLGFSMLSALSSRNDDPSRASRPFDLHRDGFVLGEAGAAIVLEEWEHARRRGARIYAELVGYGAANDAYRVTDMHPQARGAIRAIEAAFNDAGVDPSALGYVNAHGTSTVEGDRAETLALRAVLGSAARGVPVSSTKSMTGHAVAAAGALELVISLMVLRDQVLPPTVNLDTPDPECDLDYVPHRARSHAVEYALSNSFGFGGQNVALIVRRAGESRR
jgi:3-oxoacyl-[acyl-carrier-protein] synthase II